MAIVFTCCDAVRLSNERLDAEAEHRKPPEVVMVEIKTSICDALKLDSSMVEHFFQDSRPKNDEDLGHAQEVRAKLMEMAFMADPLSCKITQLPKPAEWLQQDNEQVATLAGRISENENQKDSLIDKISSTGREIESLDDAIKVTSRKITRIQERLDDTGHGDSGVVWQDTVDIRVKNDRNPFMFLGRSAADSTIQRNYNIADVVLFSTEMQPAPKWMDFYLTQPGADIGTHVVNYNAKSRMFGCDGVWKVKVYRKKGDPTPALAAVQNLLLDGNPITRTTCCHLCNPLFCICIQKGHGGKKFLDVQLSNLEKMRVMKQDRLPGFQHDLLKVNQVIKGFERNVEYLEPKLLCLRDYRERIQKGKGLVSAFSQRDLKDFIPRVIPESSYECDVRVGGAFELQTAYF